MENIFMEASRNTEDKRKPYQFQCNINIIEVLKSWDKRSKSN